MEAQTKAVETVSKYIYLINNPRNLNIYCDTNGFFVQFPDKPEKQRYSGIKNILRDTFWPDYVYKRGKSSGNSGVKNSFEGIERGKLIHSQLEDWIKLPIVKYAKKYPNGHHEYTQKVLNYLSKRELVPKQAEFPIYDESSKLATSIDCICFNTKTKGFVIVDWKSIGGYILTGNSRMKGPPSINAKYNNSPLHQAYFQLCVEMVILEKKYGVKADEAFVIQVDETGVTRHKVPDDFLAVRAQIYDTLVKNKDRMKEESKQQSKEKAKIKARERYQEKKKEKEKEKEAKGEVVKKEVTKRKYKPKANYVNLVEDEPNKEEKKLGSVNITKRKNGVAEVKTKTIKPKKKKKIDPDLFGIEFPDSF
jgi:hypothetical protein